MHHHEREVNNFKESWSSFIVEFLCVYNSYLQYESEQSTTPYNNQR